MLHRFIPKTIAMQTYLITTIIITILMIVLGWIYAAETKQRIISEQERTLIKIATTLALKIDSYETSSLPTDTTLSKEADLGTLRTSLQTIVEDLAKDYPGYGMGYGTHQARLAFYPFTPEGYTSARDPRVSEAYSTKTMTMVKLNSSVLGSVPTITLIYPLVNKGVMFGHAWANVRLHDIDKIVYQAWFRIFIILFITWIGLIVLLKFTFARIRRALNEFSSQIAKQSDSSSKLEKLPELKSVLQTVIKLKESLLKSFNLNPNIMMLISIEDKCYVDVNDAFLKACSAKKEDIIGSTVNDFSLLIDNKQRMELRDIVYRQGNLCNYELDFKSGNNIRNGLISAEKIEVNGNYCMLYVITDVTEKKQLEFEIAKYDRLNFIGQIAASIGHEIRNPMTVVRGYLQMFQRKEVFDRYKEQLGTMIDELDRANSIITEFLSLAKNKAQDLKPSDLNSIINAIFPLIQADASRLGHTLHVDLQGTPTLVLDEKEIRQVLLNLTRNALEAMVQRGVVTIRTYYSSEKVFLAVSDTGIGMSQEIVSKLGTPFFTTKDNGTGLGLAVCYRVAQRHNAQIDIKTSENGTTVSMSFPVPNKLPN